MTGDKAFPTPPMKNPDRQTVAKLTDLPNIGKAIASDLQIVGIKNPQDLIGRNAYQLHDELCKVTGEKHDPCVIDVFLAVIDFMEGGDPVPWWKFTAERKAYLIPKVRSNSMIEMIDIGVEKAIAYRLGGKITEDEMTSILSIFKAKIENGEKLLVYQEVVSIGGVEFDAMIEKFKFFREVGFSHFDKIAVVTHTKWLHKIVDIEDKIFRNIKMKGFSVDEKDQAIEFLKST